jgi:hypothetical protein
MNLEGISEYQAFGIIRETIANADYLIVVSLFVLLLF